MTTPNETEIGIEQARKILGDLANRAALAGETIHLTRNGVRIARIVAEERTAPDPGKACTAECATHGLLCELDADHQGDHECVDCPAYRVRQRKTRIADRVAAHRAAELVEMTPEVD